MRYSILLLLPLVLAAPLPMQRANQTPAFDSVAAPIKDSNEWEKRTADGTSSTPDKSLDWNKRDFAWLRKKPDIPPAPGNSEHDWAKRLLTTTRDFAWLRKPKKDDTRDPDFTGVIARGVADDLLLWIRNKEGEKEWAKRAEKDDFGWVKRGGPLAGGDAVETSTEWGKREADTQGKDWGKTAAKQDEAEWGKRSATPWVVFPEKEKWDSGGSVLGKDGEVHKPKKGTDWLKKRNAESEVKDGSYEWKRDNFQKDRDCRRALGVYMKPSTGSFDCSGKIKRGAKQSLTWPWGKRVAKDDGRSWVKRDAKEEGQSWGKRDEKQDGDVVWVREVKKEGDFVWGKVKRDAVEKGQSWGKRNAAE